jgi:ketosteroid isomerase-like protein
MTVDDNKAIVRRAFEALLARDRSALQELLAPDAVLHQCGFLQPIPADAIMKGEFPGRGPLNDRQVRLARIIGEGDLVALQWWTSGHFSDPDSPTLDGKPVSFPSMSFARVEDGKIAEIWNIQDVSTLQTQLHQPSEPAGTRHA